MSARVACANCTGPCTGVRRDERGRAVCCRCPTAPPPPRPPARPKPPPRRCGRPPGFRGAYVPPDATHDDLRGVLARFSAVAIVARERGTP